MNEKEQLRDLSEMQARRQQDPHYIPWIAVSAKTEFVRFAYTPPVEAKTGGG